MRKRKICILTQPLHVNYGGLLQAFALQKVLKDMGHDVTTDKSPQLYYSFFRKFLVVSKRILSRYLLFRKVDTLYPKYLTYKEKDYAVMSRKTEVFIQKNISSVDLFEGKRTPSGKLMAEFDTVIVGSDQIWRPRYSCINKYFLSFLSNDRSKCKIAYAASFGVSEWEFSAEQTANARALIKQFRAVSLREDSGVNLCKKHLGADAVHVLDPTLLLDKEEYIRLVEEDHTPVSEGSLLIYVLDQNRETSLIVDAVKTKVELLPYSVMPQYEDEKFKYKSTYPPVTQWLRGFMDAEFVVTDSFHGTVFSILFNKPFIVIANKERGAARFISLLKIFSLEERLIYSIDELSPQLLSKSIDFNKVNMILEKERVKSISFLKHALE